MTQKHCSPNESPGDRPPPLADQAATVYLLPQPESAKIEEVTVFAPATGLGSP
jgi:hypothetical protein